MRYLILLALPILFFACTSNKGSDTNEAPSPEAISFTGKPLFAPPVEPAALQKSDSIINGIKNKGNLSEEDYITIGQQLVSTSRYQEAIKMYSEGIEKYPQSFKLLRHRGHRYISVRQLDNAIADLNKAEELIRDLPDVPEYDASGQVTGTYQHWIWYHIGLYYFLNQSYIQAVPAYEKCLEAARNEKNTVGVSDWLYNTHMRLGDTLKAMKVLEPITADYNTDKDHPYFRRVMLYKGVITPEELVDVNQDPLKTSVQDVTKMYGLANWYAYQGEEEKAIDLYKKIVKSESGWPGFAYAAAEKELANRSITP